MAWLCVVCLDEQRGVEREIMVEVKRVGGLDNIIQRDIVSYLAY